MIAEAVKNCVPRAKNVSVDLATIRFTDKDTGERYVYQTPAGAQAALVNFDQGNKPEPFKFRLATLFQIRPKPIGRRSPTLGIGVSRDDTQNPDLPVKSRPHVSAPVKIGGLPIPRSILGGGKGGITRRFGLRTLPSGTPGGKMLPADEGQKPETS